MTILDKITALKRIEVAAHEKTISLEKLKEMQYFSRECNSLKTSLDQKKMGIIAEFKQKSPSRGTINSLAKVEVISKGYAEAGAAGISVLTDAEFFGGSLENLVIARKTNPVTPILRKDFIIGPYQVYESKAYGADLILLIAACLAKDELHHLAGIAKNLGLEILTEIHNEEELEKISPLTDLVGVNNRNLKTFEVDINTSVRLAKLIPNQFLKISESGISDLTSIQTLGELGYKGFLIGETFMRTSDPVQACKKLISDLK